MEKISLEMKPIISGMFFRVFSGDGQAEIKGGTVEVNFGRLYPDVQLSIKSSLIEKAQIPDHFSVTIEWDE